MKKRTTKLLLYLLSALLLIIGLLIFTYPLISEHISNSNSKIAVENYENYKDAHTTKKTENQQNNNTKAPDKTLTKLYEQMKKYNERIYNDNQKGLTDAWKFEQIGVNLVEYGLNDCPVGVLRVPKMEIEMPLYLGASYNNMAKGAAQLGETSMPIGGNNTNCVIAGHRGWNGAKYFLYIENMTKGDRVYIDNLWETLEYKVTDIKVISPDNIDAVKIQKGKDMVTLFTCHPYWDNTYRYAVFCTRVKDNDNNTNKNQSVNNISNENNTTNKADVSVRRIKMEQVSYYLIPLALVFLTVVLLVFTRKRK